jgi:hypothetical protein
MLLHAIDQQQLSLGAAHSIEMKTIQHRQAVICLTFWHWGALLLLQAD